MPTTTSTELTGWFSHDLLIGGKNSPADTGERFDVVNPATGAVIASVASASATDGLRAVATAKAAMAGWASEAPRARAEILRAAFELLSSHAEDLARLIVLENGKSLPDARSEVAYATEFFRWYSEEAVRLQGRDTAGTKRNQPHPGTSPQRWPRGRSGPHLRPVVP